MYGHNSYDGSLVELLDQMPEVVQGFDHKAWRRKETSQIIQLRQVNHEGFRELENAFYELEELRAKIIAKKTEKPAIITVEVVHLKQVGVLVGNGNRAIIELYFDRAFLLEGKTLRIASSRGVLQASLRG